MTARLLVPVIAAVDSPLLRDTLASYRAGCDCPRAAIRHPWPLIPAALHVIAHHDPCDPRGRTEPRFILLVDPDNPPAFLRKASREW